MDFSRGLNQDLIPASHPPPLPSDIFNQIGDSKFFSNLDLSQAYHHIVLHPDSRPLTAFLTESHGFCQFKCMPMGMTDSGPILQRQVERCLAGLQGVHPYVDDIFIHGRTRQEHDQRLRLAIRSRLRNLWRATSLLT
ncbi:MAG: RNA-directed DNA polymerase [Gammaproteobacteria bacterium]|nr:RNA-directed DNA polymerase [Gammaproteobacteria bacterium]